MRTWEITQILQFTVLTNVDVNGSQIVKVYCYWTMKCLNVLSLWKMYFHLPCQRNVWQDSQPCILCWIIIINPQHAATCRASLSRETVAVSETILVTLSPYGMCRHWKRHYSWFLLTYMRIGGGPSRGREWYSPISIFAIVARFNITNGRVLDAIGRAWANAIRSRLLASKILYEDYSRRHEAKINADVLVFTLYW